MTNLVNIVKIDNQILLKVKEKIEKFNRHVTISIQKSRLNLFSLPLFSSFFPEAWLCSLCFCLNSLDNINPHPQFFSPCLASTIPVSFLFSPLRFRCDLTTLSPYWFPSFSSSFANPLFASSPLFVPISTSYKGGNDLPLSYTSTLAWIRLSTTPPIEFVTQQSSALIMAPAKATGKGTHLQCHSRTSIHQAPSWV
jgi:hypothetical protein